MHYGSYVTPSLHDDGHFRMVPYAILFHGFGNPGHVYDVLEGRYVGHVARFEAAIGPSEAKLYAVLPHKGEGLRVELDSRRLPPGATLRGTVQVLADARDACRHVIHLAVTRPDGRSVRYLAANLDAPKGAAQFAVPLCLNEPPGAWTLTCTDAATKEGRRGEGRGARRSPRSRSPPASSLWPRPSGPGGSGPAWIGLHRSRARAPARARLF